MVSGKTDRSGDSGSGAHEPPVPTGGTTELPGSACTSPWPHNLQNSTIRHHPSHLRNRAHNLLHW